MPIADQQDAAMVAAMARQAIEDAQLIEGAGLSLAEARALFDGEACISGRGQDLNPPDPGFDYYEEKECPF